MSNTRFNLFSSPINGDNSFSSSFKFSDKTPLIQPAFVDTYIPLNLSFGNGMNFSSRSNAPSLLPHTFDLPKLNIQPLAPKLDFYWAGSNASTVYHSPSTQLGHLEFPPLTPHIAFDTPTFASLKPTFLNQLSAINPITPYTPLEKDIQKRVERCPAVVALASDLFVSTFDTLVAPKISTDDKQKLIKDMAEVVGLVCEKYPRHSYAIWRGGIHETLTSDGAIAGVKEPDLSRCATTATLAAVFVQMTARRDLNQNEYLRVKEIQATCDYRLAEPVISPTKSKESIPINNHYTEKYAIYEHFDFKNKVPKSGSGNVVIPDNDLVGNIFQGIGNGIVGTFTGLKQLVTHPLDSLMVPLNFIVDAQVIHQHNFYKTTMLVVGREPIECGAAAFADQRMNQRYENVRLIYDAFDSASGYKKMGMLTELGTAFLMPGAIVSSLSLLKHPVMKLFNPPLNSFRNDSGLRRSYLFRLPQPEGSTYIGSMGDPKYFTGTVPFTHASDGIMTIRIKYPEPSSKFDLKRYIPNSMDLFPNNTLSEFVINLDRLKKNYSYMGSHDLRYRYVAAPANDTRMLQASSPILGALPTVVLGSLNAVTNSSFNQQGSDLKSGFQQNSFFRNLETTNSIVEVNEHPIIKY